MPPKTDRPRGWPLLPEKQGRGGFHTGPGRCFLIQRMTTDRGQRTVKATQCAAHAKKSWGACWEQWMGSGKMVLHLWSEPLRHNIIVLWRYSRGAAGVCSISFGFTLKIQQNNIETVWFAGIVWNECQHMSLLGDLCAALPEQQHQFCRGTSKLSALAVKNTDSLLDLWPINGNFIAFSTNFNFIAFSSLTLWLYYNHSNGFGREKVFLLPSIVN